MAPKPRFVHLTGARRGAVDALAPEGALLGRDAAQCHVVVGETDDAVSRVHAQVWQHEGTWWIVDRSGRGGTTVNGASAASALALPDGAVVGLGPSVRLTFRLSSEGGGDRRVGGAVLGLVLVVAAVVLLLPGSRSRWLPVIDRLVGVRSAESVAVRKDDGSTLSEPVLSGEVRTLLADLSGKPYRCPIPDTFLEEVRDELVAMHRTKRSQCTMQQWRGPVREALRQEATRIGQPLSRADALVYLAWVESNYEAQNACSLVGARGMWQFMPATAREYHLTVEGSVDQRCNWQQAAGAAMRYLGGLFEQCGEDHPLLAIAGYNTGGRRSCKVAADDPCKGWDFRGFYVRGTLHDETTEYVPRFVASWLVGEAPEIALAEAQRRDASLHAIPGCASDEPFVPPTPSACATPASTCVDQRKR